MSAGASEEVTAGEAKQQRPQSGRHRKEKPSRRDRSRGSSAVMNRPTRSGRDPTRI
jgi:hypothetical protein